MVTSTSKIKKITVMIKNRNEKELRILWSGSNPHSNELSFSRFSFALIGFMNKERPTKQMRISIRSVKRLIRIKVLD